MRRRSFCSLFTAREGVGALEFALVAVPFLMLSFGAIEFGRLVWTREALQMTAIQGARCMGLRARGCTDVTSSTSYIQTEASGWLITLTSGQITRSYSGANACAGLAEVTINYTFQTAVPGLLTMLSGGSSLTGHACFPNQS